MRISDRQLSRSSTLGSSGRRPVWLERCFGTLLTFALCFVVYASFAIALYWFALSSFHALQTNGRQQIALCERSSFSTCSRFLVHP